MVSCRVDAHPPTQLYANQAPRLVYNIIMDFFFATLPWFITRHLEMRKVEKIGLCITLSLGMIVAIVAAVRVSWKDDGNTRDPYYIRKLFS